MENDQQITIMHLSFLIINGNHYQIGVRAKC